MIRLSALLLTACTMAPMRRAIAAALCALTLAACSTAPAFNSAAGLEYDHEQDTCILNEQVITGWHHCHQHWAGHDQACCPDGFACSRDEFVPRVDARGDNYCVYHGDDGDGPPEAMRRFSTEQQ